MPTIPPDEFLWTYRVLLSREPTSVETAGLATVSSRTALCEMLLASQEFAQRHPGLMSPARRVRVIKLLDAGLRLHVDLGDIPIGPAIVLDAWEVAEIDFATRSVHAGDVVVDGGAHVGRYAVAMAAIVGPTGHVHAFEPHGGSADLLAASIVENGFGQRMTLHRAAIGEQSEHGWLTEVEGVSAAAYARLVGGDAPSLAGVSRVAVPILALDDVQFNGRVRFVKLDVEGAESRALAGARRLLAEDRPVVLADLHGGRNADATFADMTARNYHAYSVAPDGRLGHRLEQPPPDGVANIVFMPAERTD